MFDKDKSSWGSSSKKEKKEKPQRIKSEGKKLFGGKSFGGGSSFGKSSSFGSGSSFGKEKKERKEKPKKEKKSFGGNSGDSFGSGEKENFFKRLKWWHILLAIAVAGIMIATVVAGAIWFKNTGIGSAISGILGGDDDIDDEIEHVGTVTSIGTFTPKDTDEYILCEYTEYFSGEKTLVWNKASEVCFNYNPYYVLVSESGQAYYDYAYEYTGEVSQEEVRQDLLVFIQEIFRLTDEQISHYDVRLYEPLSFTRVKISEATLTETEVTIKYGAGAVDGEMSEEYILIGTYTKVENDFIFTYPTLPENEHLLRVAESLFTSAKYEYYVYYNQYVNKLTFGDYALYLTTPAEETPEA